MVLVRYKFVGFGLRVWACGFWCWVLGVAVLGFGLWNLGCGWCSSACNCAILVFSRFVIWGVKFADFSFRVMP